jgi:cell surface protein SprA
MAKRIFAPIFGVVGAILCVLGFNLASPVPKGLGAKDFGFDGDTTKPSFIDSLPPYRRGRRGDIFGSPRGRSPFVLKFPAKNKISLDTTGKHYNIDEEVGDQPLRDPSRMTFEEYRQWKFKENQREYWRSVTGKDTKDTTSQKTAKKDGKAIPSIPLSPSLGRLFGGDQIDITPNGSVLLDFGGLWQRVANPNVPVRQQRTGGMNFRQQLQVALVGTVGKKLRISANLDTRATFQYEQQYKMAYSSEAHDIIQNVSLGNLQFRTKNSLITGAKNLFGVSTELRFGKLWVRGVASTQRGSLETMVIKNGAQGREFEILGHAYDNNRHFFLAHFFRENYERSLKTLPLIISGVNITRVEVYVTNRTNDTETQREIIAYNDLGERNPFSNNPFVGLGKPPLNQGADNAANDLFANARGLSRNPDDAKAQLEATGLIRGNDYEPLRARKLVQGRDYTFQPLLGYISLTQPLRNDEVMAVSFEYTFNGQVFRVGELTEDYQSRGDKDVIILKMLRPSSIRTDLPTWDLMMKNIYTLNTLQLKRNNFQLRVVYRDDLTGQDNPSLHEGELTRNVPLVELVGADRLNPNGDPQPDGNFDYINDVTVTEQFGRIIFPVLEPFGSSLKSKFLPSELELQDKYVFEQLYRGVQADAILNTTKNKFVLKGTYQSGTSNEIMLNAFNIARGSVMIRAGNSILTEGTDYTVDYQIGRIRILNEGVLISGKEIRIQYERSDPFNFQVRTLVGTELEYRFNKKFDITGTYLLYNERPAITRVVIGQEPVRNHLWGLAANYRSDSRLLTKIVDAIPGISTKAESKVVGRAEFAQLLPSNPRLLGKNGTAYIDDFEGAEVPYDLTRSPISWYFGRTPLRIGRKDPNNTLELNYRRAKLAWYNIDNIFYFTGGNPNFQRPGNITDKDMQNHYVRPIRFNEVFPNRQADQINLNEVSFDLAFYPDERGSYNYNPNLNSDGKLPNPRQNFGAITRAVTHDVDFDNINIQYIEFWLLDPFIQGERGSNNTTGGKIYFNLGTISEDAIPDGKHFFENGLPENTSETDYGRTPNGTFLTDAFSSDGAQRAAQDVGFDGLNDEAERQKFQTNYLNPLSGVLNPQALQTITADPAADNFRHYLDGSFTAQNAKVLERYKNFNGTQGNSPLATGNNFVPSSTNIPDNEDLNRDNTLLDQDQYFEYEVDLRPGLNSPYIANKVVARVADSGDSVTWYQFRIPIRDSRALNYGGINDFKSIRYIRTYMTDWEQPVVLRMVQFQLVGAQWRPYTQSLNQGGLGKPSEPGQLDFRVSSVNIEENGQFTGENVPYVVPPTVTRDYDVTSQVTRRINEQALQVCTDALPDGESRAVFKNIPVDLVNYRRLKMEIHAQSPQNQVRDGELSVFLRIGTDFTENYYEIESPLKMTNSPNTNPLEIWPDSNRIDFATQDLYIAKVKRNAASANRQIPFTVQIGRYKVSIVGNPDLSAIRTVMLGIRNPQNDNRKLPVCVWFNELRATDFDRTAGWAANLSVDATLADFATIRASARYSTVGFGGIQDKVSDRQRSTNLDLDFNSNVALDKFFLNKIGISLPMFVSYERRTSKPFFNPLDPDVPVSRALEGIREDLKPTFESKIMDITERRAINFTNIKKVKMNPKAKKYAWDVENLTATFAFSEEFRRNGNMDEFRLRNWKVELGYAYSFQSKPLTPFKKINGRFFKSSIGKLVQDFNLQYVPKQVTLRGGLNRSYNKTQYRNGDLSTTGFSPLFQKSFTFDRFYTSQWPLTNAINLDYNAVANAIIDEPTGQIERDFANDSIMKNLRKFGRLKMFNQTVGATYTLPTSKITALDFLTSTLRYQAGFIWQAGAVGLADSLGHTIKNSATNSANAKIDFSKLWNKSPYLKFIAQQSQRRVQPGQKPAEYDPLEESKKSKNKKIKKLEDKFSRRKYRMDKHFAKRIKKYEKKISKGQIKLGEADLPSYDIGRLARRKQKLEDRVKLLTAKQKTRGEAKPMPLAKMLGSTLIAVKDFEVRVDETRTTTIPGFMLTPEYMGINPAFNNAPGLPFVLGSQDPNIRFEAARNGWLSRELEQNNPFLQTRKLDISFRSNVNPSKDFTIALEGRVSRGSNYSEVFRYDEGQTDQFQSLSPVRSGNYGVSSITILTAFGNSGVNSSAFNKFVQNRNSIKQRLELEQPNLLFDSSAQNVIVPAFLAAYTGTSTSKVELSGFPRVPLPNWSITYNGLSKLKALKDRFKSITLNHKYSSQYTVGSFTSNLFYSDPLLGYDLSLARNEWEFNRLLGDTSGRAIPVLVMNQVAISENFSPLIGLTMKTQNDIGVTGSFGRIRTLSLNLANAQVTEVVSNNVTFNVNYQKKPFKVPIKFNGKNPILENQVTMDFAITVRDTKTLQRKTDVGSQFTQGNLSATLRPSISYALNKAVTLQLYFERTLNQPYVSSSYRRTTTAFGIQLRYALTAASVR